MRRFRFIGVALVFALMLAPAAQASPPGAACGTSGASSALNEYCQDVPSSAGGSVPTLASPTVAGQLPRSVARHAAGLSAGDPRRLLLNLPASGASTGAPARSGASHAAVTRHGSRIAAAAIDTKAGSTSLLLPLLIALAVATTAVVLVGRLRRR